MNTAATEPDNASALTPAADLLVIGYGNELRGDDAVGPRVAAAMAAAGLPHLRVFICHQLTPELAETISKARAVIFVDAIAETVATQLSVEHIEPCASPQLTGHIGDPRSLLALAQRVFGRCPQAWSISVPGSKFEFGEELSLGARRGIADAVEFVTRLCALTPV